MNITDLIVELLQKGQKVELPGIGTFDSEVNSPHHDPETRIYYPATRTIVFSPTTTGDMSTVKIIAQRDCVGEDVAQQMWHNYIDALTDKIKRTGEHRFGELGTLYTQGEGYAFTMAEGLVIEAGNGNETPLEEVKTYIHNDSDDPFAQFEAEPVQVVKPANLPEMPKASESSREQEATEAPEIPVAPEASEPTEHAEPAADDDEDSWKESLKKLDELPKSKAMLKAEAKAEKERLKAEAKAEKERKKLLKRGAKDAEEERRLKAEQQQAEAAREEEARRRAEEELRQAELRAEENRRKAEKKEAASLQRAEAKAEEERLKAEKRAAILATVAASQSTKDNVVANASVSASGVDALKMQKEAERRQKEEEINRKAAEKAAEKERERQLKEEEKRRKEEEKLKREEEKKKKEEEKKAQEELKRQEEEEKRQRKAEQKRQEEEEKRQRKEELKRREEEEKRQRKEAAKSVAAVEPVVAEPVAKEEGERKKHRWVLWLLLVLLLLCGAGAAYYFLKMRHAEPSVAQVGGKHLDVPAVSYFSFNPDMIEYKDSEISRNTDQVCANVSEYVMNFLASRNFTNARVPMMDRVRSYSQERMGKMMGKRYALQHFVPFDDYIYQSSEPWIKQTYAGRVRHVVQGELMNVAVLDDLLENLVDELGLQPGTPQRTASEVNQVKETERATAAPKNKKTATESIPVYVYVEKNSKQGFDIIAGFYLNKTTAAKMTARLHEQGCDAYIIEKNDMYYVSMGSAPTRTKAEALFNHIKSWYDGDIVIKEL